MREGVITGATGMSRAGGKTREIEDPRDPGRIRRGDRLVMKVGVLRRMDGDG
ncbi:MAG: hypothetical protein Q4C47_00995 [Planctomycetia bacterium]|nr:hypothetical protein [Planctomycetia bacterium]